MCSVREGWLTMDHNLVAKLLAAGATLGQIDESELVNCTCGCQFRTATDRRVDKFLVSAATHWHMHVGVGS
jgi:hypothetical protein